MTDINASIKAMLHTKKRTMTQYRYVAYMTCPGADDKIVVHGNSVRDLGKKLNIHPNTVLNVLYEKPNCATARNISILRFERNQPVTSLSSSESR